MFLSTALAESIIRDSKPNSVDFGPFTIVFVRDSSTRGDEPSSSNIQWHFREQATNGKLVWPISISSNRISPTSIYVMTFISHEQPVFTRSLPLLALQSSSP
jgi:hypothetical protein